MEKSTRTAYYAIGTLLILGAVLGFHEIFAILLGIILIVEAYLGWCSIPYLMNKLGKGKSDDTTPPTV
jgi:hypothetical protein